MQESQEGQVYKKRGTTGTRGSTRDEANKSSALPEIINFSISNDRKIANGQKLALQNQILRTGAGPSRGPVGNDSRILTVSPKVMIPGPHFT